MRYGIVGSSGRMGLEVAQVFGAAGHELVLTVDENGGAGAEASPAVIVDFSRSAALPGTIALCREHGAALVLGTTGLSGDDRASVQELAASRAVVQSANFGPGINLLSMILREYAPILSDWTMELTEAHHEKKIDAPSGTALMLMHATGRECPIHSLRLGNLPGDHEALFSNGDELMTFSHKVINRRSFAHGALLAAGFAVNSPPGLYDFEDVLRASRVGK